MFKVTQSDIVRIGILGGLTAVGIGALAAVILTALWTLDILEGTSSSIWLILVGVAQFAGVMGVAQIMQAISGRKYANSLRILAAALALLFYVAEVMAVEMIGQIFPTLLVGAGILVHLPALIGFGFGIYYAMQRFKPM